MKNLLFVFLMAGALHAQSASSANVDRARAILLAGLGDKDPDIRVQALHGLGIVGHNEEMIKGLNNLLEDKDFKVRIAAIGALVDLKETAAIPALQNRVVSDDVPEVAYAAAKALYGFKDPQGKTALEAMFSKEMKTGSNMIRSKMRDFVRTVKTPRSAMLMAIRNGAGYIPLPGFGEGVGAAIDLMTDGDMSARANVVLLMVTDRSEENKKMVTAALTDNDWTVRAAGVQSVAGLNWVEFFPQIEAMLDDKKEKVRYRVAATYLRLVALKEKGM